MPNINFIPFPILTTERLTLRQLLTGDAQSIFALRSDETVNKYLDRAPARSVEDAVNFINKINDNIKSNNSVYWVITLRNTGAFAGTICLFDLSEENSSCEIGYELLPTFSGQGIMQEAAEKVIDYAFKTLQFQKIAAFTHPANQHSTKLLTKLNFVKSAQENTESPDLDLFILTGSSSQL